ncbi:hypothetical protein V8G54_029572 [Vigna mungo]|uniref:Uncharacterized protein n=1 Tax=Vigna mungo TaxID=3915 RepID=A0AAQ3RKF8_VIGMU
MWLYGANDVDEFREEADDEQAHILVFSSRCPSHSRFSGSWWCEVVLDLGFVDDMIFILDELAIGLCGLRRNEPEWFAVTRFWIIMKLVVVSRGDTMKDFLTDSLIVGVTKEKTYLQFGFYDLDFFVGSMEALCFTMRFKVLDNDDSHGGCTRREMQATHGDEVVTEKMRELAVLGLSLCAMKDLNLFLRWFSVASW